MKNLNELNFDPCSFGGENEPTQKWALASYSDVQRVQHGVWQSGPGELNLNFTWCETIFILEGEAEIENKDTGEKQNLKPGSLMSFERGSTWTWKIPWKLKKVFTIIE